MLAGEVAYTSNPHSKPFCFMNLIIFSGAILLLSTLNILSQSSRSKFTLLPGKQLISKPTNFLTRPGC